MLLVRVSKDVPVRPIALGAEEESAVRRVGIKRRLERCQSRRADGTRRKTARMPDLVAREFVGNLEFRCRTKAVEGPEAVAGPLAFVLLRQGHGVLGVDEDRLGVQ